MRICSRCQESKPDTEFSSKGRGKLQYFCRDCVRLYNKEYYALNRTRYLLKAQKRNASQRQELRRIIEVLKNRPCSDCGVQYPTWVMEFDHRDGSEKVANVSDMGRWSYATQTVLNEIAKCDVVCANCHRQRTYVRANRKNMHSATCLDQTLTGGG